MRGVLHSKLRPIWSPCPKQARLHFRTQELRPLQLHIASISGQCQVQHADDEVFAFSAAENEGIKFVNTYADEEDFDADPTANDQDAPAEAEGSGEADQLDGQEAFKLEAAIKNSQSVKCHCCGQYGHLTQHCELLSQMPDNRETWRLIVRLKRDGKLQVSMEWCMEDCGHMDAETR